MARVIATVVAALALCALPAAAAPSGGAVPDRDAARQLLKLVNATRALSGAAALVADPDLTAIAEGWSAHMASTGVLAHNDAFFTRETHRRLRISYFAENVGWNYTLPGVHAAFLASPHHRDNLLVGKYRLAGFAVVRDTKGRLWVTEDFGTPRKPAAVTAVVAKPAPAPVVRVVHPAPAPVRRAAARPSAVKAPSKPRVQARPVAARPATKATAPVYRFRRGVVPRAMVIAPASAVGLPVTTTPVSSSSAVPGWAPLAGVIVLYGAAVSVARTRRSTR